MIKKFLILFFTICLLCSTNIYASNAKPSWSEIMYDYVNNYKDNNFDVKFAVINTYNDNTPEIILKTYLNDNNNYYIKYDIIKFSGDELINVLSFEHKNDDNVFWLYTKSEDNLYNNLTVGLKSSFNDASIQYYLIDMDKQDRYSLRELGGIQSEDYTISAHFEYSIYNNIPVDETVFCSYFDNKYTIKFSEANDKFLINDIIHNYESNSNDNKINNSNPTIYQDVFSDKNKKLYVYTQYANGSHEYLEYLDSAFLLMINGNFVPRANLIKEDSSYYIPIRTLAEYSFQDLYWNNLNKTITLADAQNKIVVDTVNKNIKVNGKSNLYNSSIKIVRGITYIDVSFIPEIWNISIFNDDLFFTPNIITIEKATESINSITENEAKNIINEINNKYDNNYNYNIHLYGKLGRYYIVCSEKNKTNLKYKSEYRKIYLINKYTSEIFLFDTGIRYIN